MNRDEQKLRDAFQHKLGDMKPSTPVETIRRGARRGRMMTALATALFVLVAGIGGYALTRATEGEQDRLVGPRPESNGGRIAFARFGEGIMTMKADGSEVTAITPPSAYASNGATWSPDATKIAFTGYYGPARNEGGGIFVADLDGSNRELLELAAAAPTWSPDGERVAFYSAVDGSIRVIDVGNRRTQIVVPPEGGRKDSPDWSPDGRSILFASDGIYKIDVQGGAAEQIIPPHNRRWRSYEPQWSPTGTQIAFTAPGADGVSTIDIVDADGKGRRTLTEGASPTWSPDGQHIAFERADEPDTSHIYSINVDGTDQRQLTFGDVADHSPDWGPAPSGQQEEVATFGRYTFSIGGGFDDQGRPVDKVGIVDIDVDGGTICVQSQILGASAAHLHRTDETHSTITIFEPPTNYRPTLCARNLDQAPLQEVIDDPSVYFIEFHNKNSGDTLIAPLEPMGEPAEDRSEAPYCVGDDICLSRNSGPAGVDVTASVPASGTGENGVDVVHTDRVEWWWGLEGDEWIDVFEGSPPEGAFMLASADEPRNDRLVTSFIVPSGHDPGTYPIFAISYSSDGGEGAAGAEIDFEVTDGYGCPTLLDPGPYRAFLEARPVFDAYLEARQPDEAKAFDYGAERLERPILGGPEGDCSAETWQRSYEIEGSYVWKGDAKTRSASLGYFRFVVGRAEGGWVIWAVAH